jgi:glycosyltransferase involved in cell wall biosynthesis
MALGKPVVAGAEGGPAEILVSTGQDAKVPFGDSVALAEALLSDLRRPTEAAATGRIARVRAFEFSADAFADSLLTALGV